MNSANGALVLAMLLVFASACDRKGEVAPPPTPPASGITSPPASELKEFVVRVRLKASPESIDYISAFSVFYCFPTASAATVVPSGEDGMVTAKLQYRGRTYRKTLVLALLIGGRTVGSLAIPMPTPGEVVEVEGFKNHFTTYLADGTFKPRYYDFSK